MACPAYGMLTEGAPDEATRLFLLGVPTYKVRGDNEMGYYWHVSRPGRPGDQSDTFPTEAECVEDVAREYPDAVRVA